MNTDSVLLMLKYAGLMLLILGIVFVLAIITPWLAKKVDKVLPKKKDPARVENEDDVKGVYDAQIENSKNDDNGEADKNG